MFKEVSFTLSQVRSRQCHISHEPRRSLGDLWSVDRAWSSIEMTLQAADFRCFKARNDRSTACYHCHMVHSHGSWKLKITAELTSLQQWHMRVLVALPSDDVDPIRGREPGRRRRYLCLTRCLQRPHMV